MSAYPTPALLAPGTLARPACISEADWEHMPWPAKWRATRRLLAETPDWLVIAHRNRDCLTQVIAQRGTRHIAHFPRRHSEGIAS